MFASSVGALCAVLLSVLAWRRSRTSGGYYDADVYAMTSAIHRRYAMIGVLFVALFLFSLATIASVARFWIWTAFAVVVILYLTSYLRGAQEDDG